jgi:hypothetical protein
MAIAWVMHSLKLSYTFTMPSPHPSRHLSTIPWTPRHLHICGDTPALCAVYLHHIQESAVSLKRTRLSLVSSWVMISRAHTGLGKPQCQRHIAVLHTRVYSVHSRPCVQDKRTRGSHHDAISARRTATSQLHSSGVVLNLVHMREQLFR